jgi:subtilisin family serine protease
MKNESVWKILAISVALLMVASVAGAVNQTGNSADILENEALGSDEASNAVASPVPVYKHPKMSTEVAEMIPPPGIAPPAKQVIVNIYLEEDSEESIEELKNHTIEILFIKENRIVAEIYTSEILDIVDLPFVNYMDTPLKAQLFPEVTVSESGEVYKHPKMSTEVTKNIPPPGIAPPAKPMIVNVYLKENETEKIKELENYTIETLYVKENRVVAEIYTSEILDIVDLPFVSYMDTPLKAQLFPIVSEGLKCVNASEQHNRGITGEGVKVAIVDHGFEGYEDLLGTELPADVTVMSFRMDGDITGGGIIHGTGCAEVVHDVAPDAELYLVNSDGYAYQLEEIVDYLISEEVDIVSHSAGGSAGLFDGFDYSCRIIDNAVFKHGIIWVNSAGNYAQKHWEGLFNDVDSNNLHEFPDGERGQLFCANEGEVVVLLLSWNEPWGYATQDYDLCILNSSGSVVAGSENPQDGTFGHIPVERSVFLAPYSDCFYIVIKKYSATKPVYFELYSWTHDDVK